MNPDETPPSAEGVIPILSVRDFNEAVSYYTDKLLFRKLWDWGNPPNFGAVAIGKVEIFFCFRQQGNPGMWLSIFIDDVDTYHERISKLGAEILQPPQNEPWGMREMLVRDPNQHIIRFGHGLPSREPKIPIERVAIEARLEKRLAALLTDLAAHKKMTLGEMLEEMALHSFEKLPGGGIASAHTEHTHAFIQQLKQKHGLDYDCHGNDRFIEDAPQTR